VGKFGMEAKRGQARNTIELGELGVDFERFSLYNRFSTIVEKVVFNEK
jgi:hypothetical protein